MEQISQTLSICPEEQMMSSKLLIVFVVVFGFVFFSCYCSFKFPTKENMEVRTKQLHRPCTFLDLRIEVRESSGLCGRKGTPRNV